MIDNILNPAILGGAFGAALAVGFAGFFLSKLVRGFTKPEFSTFFGFVLAGILTACLAALGLADGGKLKWLQATLTYALPAGLAAIAALFLFKLFPAAGRKRATKTVVLVSALLIGALLGARFSLIERTFSDEEVLFSDPLMAGGFKALQEKYPEIWATLSSELKDSEILGKSPFPVILGFFQQHLPEFTKQASDVAVVNMAQHVSRKLEFLSETEPALCLKLAAGKTDARLVEILPYKIKLSESKALETLISSSGTKNSGIANTEEAESIVISAWERLASEDPQRFYELYSSFLGQETDDVLACEGFVKLQNFMLESTEPEFARMSRSDLNFDPETPMTSAGELRMGRVPLNADAALLNQLLPQKLDAETNFVRAQYNNKTFTYSYELSSPVGDGINLEKFFATNSMAAVCSDQDLISIMSLGVTLEYSYEGSDGMKALMSVDSFSCENR